jgi:multiple sugar transport system substrate-binding protein
VYGLGVDLGTTFLAAAVVREGRVETFPLGSRSATIPAAVFRSENGEFLVGEAAVRRQIGEPQRVATEFKRRFGDSVPLLLGGAPYSPEALTAVLLERLVGMVSAREGGPPSSVCLCHPANWGPFKIDLLRHVVRLAGVTTQVRFVSEPVAAVVHYARRERIDVGDIAAVYDLGGGTFDCAVLRRTASGFEILGRPEGIERLDGLDIDAAVFEHVRQSIPEAWADLDIGAPGALAAVTRLRQECVEAKEALSTDTAVAIPVILPGLNTEVRLTRAELEHLVREPLRATIHAMRRALVSAALTPADLRAVLLAGGFAQMPLVPQLVTEELGRPVAVDAHPKFAVALGAALLAEDAATEVPAHAGDAATRGGVTATTADSRAEAADAEGSAYKQSPAARSPAPPDTPVSPRLPAAEPTALLDKVPATGQQDGPNASVGSGSSPFERLGADQAPTSRRPRSQRRRTVIGAGLLVLALVATTFALLSGGSGDSETGGSGSTPASSIASGPATGTISVWAQAAEGAALPAFAKEFQAANPGVTVNITAIPWDEAHNKYQTAIAGGSTPDVAQMGTTWMGDFADAFVPTPSSIDTGGFSPGSVKSTQVGATKYGVPWYVDTRVIIYRKDLAKQAGYATFPATWDDFKSMAKAMQTKAGAKWGINLPAGGADAFQSMLFIPWSGGAELINQDQTKWTLDTPAWVDAMTYYKSFFTDGIATPNPNTGAGAAEAAFVDGSIPMLVGGPSQVGAIAQAGGAGFADKFAVAVVPRNKSATSFVGGSDLVVFKNSKNQNAAWKFIQWLSQPEIQVKWQKAVGDLPALQSAWKDPALVGDSTLSVFGDQLKDTNSPPSVTTWTQVSSAADTVLEQIVKAGTAPRDAMKSLQGTADSIGTGTRG